MDVSISCASSLRASSGSLLRARRKRAPPMIRDAMAISSPALGDDVHEQLTPRRQTYAPDVEGATQPDDAHLLGDVGAPIDREAIGRRVAQRALQVALADEQRLDQRVGLGDLAP